MRALPGWAIGLLGGVVLAGGGLAVSLVATHRPERPAAAAVKPSPSSTLNAVQTPASSPTAAPTGSPTPKPPLEASAPPPSPPEAVDCTYANTRVTVSGISPLAHYQVGQALTWNSTLRNSSEAPCQFPGGYCPQVEISGPQGVTKLWYYSPYHRQTCAGDHRGYVLAAGASLTVTDSWDGHSCDDARRRGVTCPTVDGLPPGGQYGELSWWDALNGGTNGNAPSGGANFYLDGPAYNPSPSP